MLGKGKRISPPQWGFFPIYVGHIPHACGEPPHRHGESGELIPPKLVYCPPFQTIWCGCPGIILSTWEFRNFFINFVTE